MFDAPLPPRSFGRSAGLALAAHGLFIVCLCAAGAKVQDEVATRVEAPVVVFYTAPVKRTPTPEPGASHAARARFAAPRPQRAPSRALPAEVEPPLTDVVFHNERGDQRALEDAEDRGNADFDGQGEGSGTGSGSGSGTGAGVGATPALRSHARRAWFVTNDWACDRPDHQEDAGRVVVRIRVTVSTAGSAGAVEVVTPGPSVFNDRARSCAGEAQYLWALDDSGAPIVGVAEFSIQFL